MNAARKLAVHSQLLDRTLPKDKVGVLKTINDLGYLQIDTISVIERAHHHTLWTRLPHYKHQMLHELQAQDRSVFEYWGHAASYLPMSDYRYYLPQMQSFFDPMNKWERDRYEKYGHMLQPVLERVREEGPLTSKSFEPAPGEKREGWWDWKPAKVVLELLFWRGELMISERKNFQRVYDLTERVLPDAIDLTVPDDDELGRFLVRRALNAYGIARAPEIREHIRGAPKGVVLNALAGMLEAGEVVQISLRGAKDQQYFALPEGLDKIPKISKRMSLLSPFDNLIINRDRTRRLFNFDYALECYTPAVKRTYGYFVLPILWGSEFVGRLDPKADRKRKAFIIRNLVFEPEFEPFDEILPKLAERIADLANFNQCLEIEIDRATPRRLKRPLKKLVDESLAQ